MAFPLRLQELLLQRNRWIFISFLLTAATNSFHYCQSLSLNSNNNSNNINPNNNNKSRRRILEDSLKVSSIMTLLLPIESASAASSSTVKAKGAAELDFEFYMRDLIGGNKREGTIMPSVAPPVSRPRTLNGPLIPLLLDKDFSPSCISVQALVQHIQQRQSNNSNSDENNIGKEIQTKAQDLRDKISKSFYSRNPWEEESITDQYYFDVTSYALWRTAAEMIPNFVERDQFVRRLGRMIYQRLQKERLLLLKSTTSQQQEATTTKVSLVDTLPATIELLDLFQKSQFCKGYRIRRDDMADSSNNNSNSKNDDEPIFDELDDDSLVSGLSVDCLVSIYEPATLGASLQINGEQSRFGPDFVGTTLAALWDSAGIKSSWETFFVDPEYR